MGRSLVLLLATWLLAGGGQRCDALDAIVVIDASEARCTRVN
ncbi:hypothetical protein ANAPRD1_01281 [Anaplasma phagocytophilum]|nr:hypothetical protein ANAPRD1_01281 [Anaplasma phagocytophilum]